MDSTNSSTFSSPQFAAKPMLDTASFGADLDGLRAQVRRVAISPSPVTELLAEPALIRLLSQSSQSSHRSRSQSKSRTNSPILTYSPSFRMESKESLSNSKDSKRRGKERDDIASILSLLSSDANQSSYLKQLLDTTNERLQAETQRALNAEQALQQSEARTREALNKVSQAEVARHEAEIQNAKLSEESKRYKLHIEFLEQELQRASTDIQALESQVQDSLRATTRANHLAEQYKDALTESRAREQGREEGRRIGMLRGFSDGRLKGWQVGKTEGFAQGRTVGIEEGRQEGEEYGRMDEREKALQAFDRFLSGNLKQTGSRSGMSDGSGDVDNIASQRTQRWVNSPGKAIHEMSLSGAYTGEQLPSPAQSWIPPSEFDDYGLSEEDRP